MASTTISTAFVKQYGETLDLLLELKGGKFKDKCLTDTIQGEERYYDQLGSVFAEEVTDRYGDSPENDITHDRRRVIATPYDVGLMLDRFDKVQMLVNPESEYVQRQVSALNRKSDIEFMNAALGTAKSGKGGDTSNVLPSSQYVAVTEGVGTTTGMNLDKLQAAREILENNDIDLEDALNTPYFAWSPQQKRELLSSTTVTSSDFNTIKALVKGDIDTFYGFNFVTSNMLPYADAAGTTIDKTWSASDVPAVSGADVRACFAWVKSGVRQATNPEITVEVERRGDKRFNWYSYACLRTGAVRMEEEKVVVVPCDQSV